MNAGQVLGGLAVAGIATLIGLAITAENESQTLTTTPTTIFAFDPTNTPPSTTTLSSSTTDASTASSTTTSGTSTGSSTSTSAATSGSAPTSVDGSTSTVAAPAPPTAAPAVPLPTEEHGGVVLRVLNGGGTNGAASFVTDVLRTDGFVPIEPADAAQPVDATFVFYAPGKEREAASVNTLVAAPPERVLPGPPEDPNWVQFGPFLDVLVVLGP